MKRLAALIIVAAATVSLWGQQPGQAVQSGLQHAMLLERQGSHEEAMALYRSLNRQFPMHKTVFNRFKEYCYRHNRLATADSLLAEYQKNYPNDVMIEAMAGRRLLAGGDVGAAMKRWQSAFEAHPGNRVLVEEAANHLIRARYYDRAVAVLEKQRSLVQDAHAFALNLASLHGMRFHYGPATRELLLYLKHEPKHWGVVEGRMISFNLTGAYLDTVVQNLRRAADKASPDFARLAARLETSVWLKAGEPEEAVKALDKAITGLDTAEMQNYVYQIARRALNGGQPRVAAAAFGRLHRAAAAFQPVMVLLGLAESAAAQGRVDEAVSAYDRLIAAHGSHNLAAKAAFSRAVLLRDRAGRPDEAAQGFKELKKTYPGTPQAAEADLELGRCHILSGKLAEADSAFSAAQLGSGPAGSETWLRAVVERAHVLFYRQQTDSALALLKGLDTPALVEAALSDDLFNDGLALRKLLNRLKRQPIPVQKRWAEAAWLQRQGAGREALEAYDDLVTKSSLSAEALKEAVKLCMDLEHWQGALDRMAPVIDKSGDDEMIWWHARALEALKRSEAAFESYERIVVDFPWSVYTEQARLALRRIEGEHQ